MPTPQLKLDKTSMFRRTPVYNIDNTVVFGLRREVITPDPSDSIIEVTQLTENRLDNISYELYGTANLFWVLAELNQIYDPMTEVAPGTQLRAPTPDRLFNLLSTST